MAYLSFIGPPFHFFLVSSSLVYLFPHAFLGLSAFRWLPLLLHLHLLLSFFNQLVELGSDNVQVVDDILFCGGHLMDLQSYYQSFVFERALWLLNFNKIYKRLTFLVKLGKTNNFVNKLEIKISNSEVLLTI